MDKSEMATRINLKKWGDNEIEDIITYTWFSFRVRNFTSGINGPEFSDDKNIFKFALSIKGNDTVYLKSLNKAKLFMKFMTSVQVEEFDRRTVKSQNLTGLFISPGEDIPISPKIPAISTFIDASQSRTQTCYLVTTCTLIIMNLNYMSNTIKDFKACFEKMEHSDVTLNVEGKDFRAHKVFLASRSPVFNAMFASRMEECQTNEVFIHDIRHDAFQEMLRFIYTGRVHNLKEMASELLAAADKYALEDLRKMCEEALALNITAETVCEHLLLADLHSALYLKSKAMEFIINNAKLVTESASWENLVTQNPGLGCELFRNWAAKQTN